MIQLPKLHSHMLAWPTDWSALFGRQAPILLEIGFGYGAFLLHLARSHPEANIVGVEIASRCLEQTERAVEREKLTNVRLIHATAETMLHHLCAPQSLSAIHINFPDPWFKRAHSHRRLMQRDTLEAMVSRLLPGGHLYLATDIREYAAMSAELLAATPQLENLLPGAWVNELPERGVRTKYENAALRAGRTCHYFVYRRNAFPAPDVPIIKDWPMPHVVVHLPLTLDEIFACFQRQDKTLDSGVYVHWMDIYRNPQRLLIETFIKEPTIEQHFAFLLAARPAAHEYTLKLSTIGHPRPTSGVHKAASALRDWVLSLHPQARVLIEKVAED